MTHNLKCKFCGCNVHCEIDDSYYALRDKIIGEVSDLLKLAACNRCADFKERKNRICAEMEKTVRSLQLERFARRDKSDVAARAIQNMRALMYRWASIVCDHLLIETQRDEHFEQMVIDKPERWKNAFYQYEKFVTKAAREAHQ